MRSLLTSLTFAAVVLDVATAHAESRTFIITNIMDDPVHGCLNRSGGCGTSVANALCRDRGFKQAATYRKLEGDDITGAVSTNGSAVGDQFFAIECAR